MKNKCSLLFLFLLLVGCKGRYKQEQSTEGKVAETAHYSEDVLLKGEVIPIDTALFRYAYRMRVQGDKAVVLDLHNIDYYYHVFTYPDFKYISSFGKRGEGPEEMIDAENLRFVEDGSVWVLDSGKNRMIRYSGIAKGETPKQEENILLDKELNRSLDFDIYNADTAVVPDYSGKNRFGWAAIPTGKLLYKSEQIPISNKKLLEESAPAVAQGWRNFISFSPDKRILVSVTQFGDILEIYDTQTKQHIIKKGDEGEPKFRVTPEGYGFPAGSLCYFDVQVTDKYIYTIYDGRKFEDIMQEEFYKQGGRLFRIYNHQGELVQQHMLDRPIAGICVDEMNHTMIAMDVNEDEQLVRYNITLRDR